MSVWTLLPERYWQHGGIEGAALTGGGRGGAIYSLLRFLDESFTQANLFCCLMQVCHAVAGGVLGLGGSTLVAAAAPIERLEWATSDHLR